MLGLSLAGIIIGLAQDNVAVQLILTAVSLLAMAVIVTAYQRLTGLWVDTTNLGPKGKRYHRTYAVTVLVCLAASFIPTQTLWFATVAAIIAFGATVVMGRHIDVLLREEIRNGNAQLP